MHKVKFFINKDIFAIEKEVNVFLDRLENVKQTETKLLFVPEKDEYIFVLDIDFEDCISFEMF